MHVDELKRSFGQRVQALREARGFTQEQLAERVGRSVDTISNIERGIYATRIEVAQRLADELGVSLSDLFRLHLSRVDQLRPVLMPLLELIDSCDDAQVAKLTELVRVGIDLMKIQQATQISATPINTLRPA